MAHIWPRFPDLALGTCVIVAPWHDRCGSRTSCAMLSNMTEQKLYIGLGRGTANYEYDAFGVDMTEARARFRETWEILDRAMTGEPFTYRGTTSRSTSPCASGRRRSASASTSSARSAPPRPPRSWPSSGWRRCARSFGVQDRRAAAGVGEARQPRSARSHERRVAAPAARQRRRRRHRRRGDRRGADLHDALHAGADRPLRRVPGRHDEREGLRGLGRDLRALEGADGPAGDHSVDGGAADRLTRHRSPSASSSSVDAGFNHIIPQTVTPGTPRDVQQRWAERFAREVAPRFSSAFSTAEPSADPEHVFERPPTTSARPGRRQSSTSSPPTASGSSRCSSPT